MCLGLSFPETIQLTLNENESNSNPLMTMNEESSGGTIINFFFFFHIFTIDVDLDQNPLNIKGLLNEAGLN